MPTSSVFAAGLVHKTYLAVAPVRAELDLPLVRRTHLVKEHGTHQAREVPGERPNAETLVELLDTTGGLGLYRLTPRTGRTHQLRCQLSGLGIPIAGDPLYPRRARRGRRRLQRAAPAARGGARVRRPRRRAPAPFRQPAAARRRGRAWPAPLSLCLGT